MKPLAAIERIFSQSKALIRAWVLPTESYGDLGADFVRKMPTLQPLFPADGGIQLAAGEAHRNIIAKRNLVW